MTCPRNCTCRGSVPVYRPTERETFLDGMVSYFRNTSITEVCLAVAIACGLIFVGQMLRAVL